MKGKPMGAGQRPRREPQQPQGQQEITIIEQHTFPTFLLGYRAMEGGGGELNFIVPNGHQYTFQVSPDAAKEVGASMVAPHVSAATPADLAALKTNGGGHAA